MNEIKGTALRICLPWLVAFGFAIGHHFYNSSRDGVVPRGDLFSISGQGAASAINVAFALVVQGLLAFSVETAFVQCAWRVVRHRAFTVGGLNALWSATRDPFSFFSVDMWRRARFVVVMAATGWCFALVVTFAPGSLSTEARASPETMACDVPTYDFFKANDFSSVNPLISGIRVDLLPSAIASRVVKATLTGGQPLAPLAPFRGNYSYTISVPAPSLQCTNTLINPTLLNLTDIQATNFEGVVVWTGNPFNAQTPLHFSDWTWDFQAYYIDVGTDRAPIGNGTFVSCITYNSTIPVLYVFNGSTSSVTVLTDKILRHNPMSQNALNTIAQPYLQSFGPSEPDLRGFGGSSPDNPFWIDGQSSNPPSALANATFGWAGLASELFSSFTGTELSITVTSHSSGGLLNKPETLLVSNSNLVKSLDGRQNLGAIRWNDVGPALEDLMNNITLSVLTLSPSTKMTTLCSFNNFQLHFSYDPERLWITYGVGLGIGLVCVVLGMLALFDNGSGRTTDFATFLGARHGTELDDVILGDKVELEFREAGKGSGGVEKEVFVLSRRSRAAGGGATAAGGSASKGTLEEQEVPMTTLSYSRRRPRDGLEREEEEEYGRLPLHHDTASRQRLTETEQPKPTTTW